MDELLNSRHFEMVRRRALRRLGGEAQGEQGEYLLIDAMACELYNDRVMSMESKRRAFPKLLQISPGGLLALGWLCSDDATVRDDYTEQKLIPLIMSYVEKLPSLGQEAMPEALNRLSDVQCAEVVQGIMRIPAIPSPARPGVCVRLLSCAYLSEMGRSMAMEKALDLPTLNKDRRSILQWATSGEVAPEIQRGLSGDVPAAPTSLARKGLLGLVKYGEDATGVVRNALALLARFPDPLPFLQGVLDIIEYAGDTLQNQLCRTAVDYCLQNNSPVLRRRAYNLAAKILGSEYLHQASKDPDFSVRTWAMRQLHGGN